MGPGGVGPAGVDQGRVDPGGVGPRGVDPGGVGLGGVSRGGVGPGGVGGSGWGGSGLGGSGSKPKQEVGGPNGELSLVSRTTEDGEGTAHASQAEHAAKNVPVADISREPAKSH